MALAVTLGVAAGAFQVFAVLFRRHVLGEFTWTSRDIIWMSPLGTSIALFLVALPFALLLTVWRRRALERIAWALVAAVAALFAFLSVRGLHPLAVLVLAAGLGVFVSGLRVRASVLLKSSAVSFLVIAFAWAIAQFQQREAPPRELTTGVGESPNVLLLILDTVRAASTSVHGYQRPTTPQLAELARNGVAFDRAIAPSSWTLPSHGAMFTGVRGSRLSASWRTPLDATHPTIAELLRDRGYATGAFVANYFYTHHESGLGRGFNVLRDFRRSPAQVLWSTTLGQTPFVNRIAWDRTPRALLAALRDFDLRVPSQPTSDRRRAAEVINEFLTWESRRASRPFFAFLNLYDAHDPYDPPAHVRTRFAPDPTPQDRYDAGIAYMDDELGRLFSVMRQRGILDNTLVIITSDHGEQWGEHDLKNHGNSLYMAAVHVPLVIHFPARVPPGTRIQQPVSLTDIGATIADAAGLHAAIPGVSLFRACCDSTSVYTAAVVTETEQLDATSRSKAPAAHGPLASLLVDSLQYIRNGDSTYQLFHHVRDPFGLSDIIADPDGCAAGIKMDAALRALAPLPATPALTDAECRPRGLARIPLPANRSH